ncbi:hypothetical protein TRFO_01929 [Tritrichomonas foetus]|uniref:Uncharacterized protein n=1 Tax=Tritrichomonas foetus TaxID=1144522 RepID=A0A1J4JI88_9EUKA|nr:hypothetical protein TRFO_01929 [Tritrichomonas foetus]|eukprot:OHS98846.1 hypothetical protein TRFO_01929 [Tritrichomonas foetus]
MRSSVKKKIPGGEDSSQIESHSQEQQILTRFPVETIDYNKRTDQLEEEIDQIFQPVHQITKDLLEENPQRIVSLTLLDFINLCNQFFNSPFISLYKRRELFAAYVPIHQHFISSNYSPSHEHLIPIGPLWETFQNTFSYLKFDQFKFDKGNCLQQISNFSANYQKIKIAFELFQQNLSVIEFQEEGEGEEVSEKSIELAIKALVNFERVVKNENRKDSLPTQLYDKIFSQIVTLRNKLSSYENVVKLQKTVKTIDQAMVSHPTFYQNSLFDNQPHKILQCVLDLHEIFIKLTSQTRKPEECQDIFEILNLIRKILISTHNSENRQTIIRAYKEQLNNFIKEKGFNDNQVLQELNCKINTLPQEYWLVKTEYSRFLLIRKDILPDCNDSQKIFQLFSTLMNFIHSVNFQDDHFNGLDDHFLGLADRLIQIYSKALINAAIYEDIEVISFYTFRLMKDPLIHEENVILDLTKLIDTSEELLECDFLTPTYQNFINRFNAFLIVLKNVFINVPPQTLTKIISDMLRFFPDLRKLTNMCQFPKAIDSILSNISILTRSKTNVQMSFQSFTDHAQILELALAAYPIYSSNLGLCDSVIIEKVKKYNNFQLAYKRFIEVHAKEPMDRKLLLEPNDFSIKITNFLHAARPIVFEKPLSSVALMKLCIDLSFCTIYNDYAQPNTVVEKWKEITKFLNIPMLKQKLHVSFRYIEMFQLMVTDNEIDNTGGVPRSFGNAFIEYCSYLDENNLNILIQNYPKLKQVVKGFEFQGFDQIFNFHKQYDNLLKAVNEVTDSYFMQYKVPLKSIMPIMILGNMLEAIHSSLSILIMNELLSKEWHNNCASIYSNMDAMWPIKNRNNFQLIINDQFKEHFKILFFQLSELRNIKFINIHHHFRNKLVFISTLFPNFLHICSTADPIRKEIEEFIQLSHQSYSSDFYEIAYRLLRKVFKILSFLKSSSIQSFELNALLSITQHAHLIIIDALLTASFSKDLDVCLNCMISIASLYTIDLSKNNMEPSYYLLNDFFSDAQCNVPSINHAKNSLIQLVDNYPKYFELFDEIEPAFNTINNIFAESMPNLLAMHLSDGNRHVLSMKTKLTSMINEIDSQILETSNEIISYRNQADELFIQEMSNSESIKQLRLEKDRSALVNSLNEINSEIIEKKILIGRLMADLDISQQLEEYRQAAADQLGNLKGVGHFGNSKDDTDDLDKHNSRIDDLNTQNCKLQQLLKTLKLSKLCKELNVAEGGDELTLNIIRNDENLNNKWSKPEDTEKDSGGLKNKDINKNSNDIQMVKFAKSFLIDPDFNGIKAIFSKERHDKMGQLELNVYKMINEIENNIYNQNVLANDVIHNNKDKLMMLRNAITNIKP